ncbi:uncharacterized protein MONOS_6502 [Monocercomonoides exilis]|uniref:uncharacterized protein n=1 Tax=Monocercomonoides exilis TaxID=2049356 RepID=UPI00355A699F|nr:hypothetical protein MONOS_6502 [Monocercomonoides exilis]|eukprot:MONOS_6502.1-p1 / transcript=MONOS_6502.1 / gene=MONOS_6502 / organism=Monocercomonoides_exilis_PA203 / gene_product=unspecified product / transcript_product=unspecified product / location=Mono_scaffold00206:4067-10344(-) / protein_length=1954 / sequence_SO=supercontig / SO=protein_coding / is_pseudo=false
MSKLGDDHAAYGGSGDGEIISDKPSKFDHFIFFSLYPLYDQTRDNEPFWVVLSWIFSTLQLFAIAICGIDFNGNSEINAIFGFMDWSSFIGLMPLGFIVFTIVAFALIVLYFLMIVIIAITLKKFLVSSPWIRTIFRHIDAFFHSFLMVPIQSILITSVDCVNGSLRVLPSETCWVSRHIILTAFSLVFFIIISFVSLAHAYFIVRIDPKHGGLNSHFNGLFAAVYSLFITMQILVMRVTMSDRGWRSILTIVPTVALIIAIAVMMPYYHFVRNAWLVVSLILYAFGRLACELGYFMGGNSANYITLWALMIFAAVACSVGVVIFMRWRLKRLYLLAPDGEPLFDPAADDVAKQLPQFKSSMLVELGLRFLQSKKYRTQKHLNFADLVYRQALRKQPSNQLLIAQYSLFTRVYKKHYLKADNLLRRSRAMGSSLFIRFVTFSHFKNAAEESNGGEMKRGDGGVLDRDGGAEGVHQNRSNGGMASMASKSLLETAEKHHQDAIMWVKEFWNNLMRPKINFEAIPVLLIRLVNSEKAASQCYEELLVMHPNNVQVLRGYGSLLHDIYRDEDAADVYFQRAEQIEEESSESVTRTMGTGVVGADQKSMTRSFQGSEFGSRVSDNSSLQRNNRKKKKKKANKQLQLLDQIQSSEKAGGGQNKRERNTIPFYIPMQLGCYMLVLVCILVGYFVTGNLLRKSLVQSGNMQEIALVSTNIGQLCLYSKLYLARFSGLYPAGDFPAWFPSIQMLKQKFATLSQALMNQLVTVYADSYFEPWELQDALLTMTSYDDAGNLKSNYTVTRGLFDAYRSFAYAAYDLGSENLLPNAVYARLANVIINFPTVIQESVKRASRQYNTMLTSALNTTNIIVIIVDLVMYIICVLLSVFVVILAFSKSNTERRRALHLLLSVPKTYIHRISMSLIASENEQTEKDRTEQGSLVASLDAIMEPIGVTHAMTDRISGEVTADAVEEYDAQKEEMESKTDREKWGEGHLGTSMGQPGKGRQMSVSALPALDENLPQQNMEQVQPMVQVTIHPPQMAGEHTERFEENGASCEVEEKDAKERRTSENDKMMISKLETTISPNNSVNSPTPLSPPPSNPTSPMTSTTPIISPASSSIQSAPSVKPSPQPKKTAGAQNANQAKKDTAPSTQNGTSEHNSKNAKENESKKIVPQAGNGSGTESKGNSPPPANTAETDKKQMITQIKPLQIPSVIPTSSPIRGTVQSQSLPQLIPLMPMTYQQHGGFTYGAPGASQQQLQMKENGEAWGPMTNNGINLPANALAMQRKAQSSQYLMQHPLAPSLMGTEQVALGQIQGEGSANFNNYMKMNMMNGTKRNSDFTDRTPFGPGGVWSEEESDGVFMGRHKPKADLRDAKVQEMMRMGKRKGRRDDSSSDSESDSSDRHQRRHRHHRHKSRKYPDQKQNGEYDKKHRGKGGKETVTQPPLVQQQQLAAQNLVIQRAAEESEIDAHLNGAVRNQIADNEWMEALGKSIAKTAESYKRLPSAITKSLIIRTCIMVAVLTIVGVVFSILLLTSMHDVKTISASLMLAGFREVQFYQLAVFIQMLAFYKRDIPLDPHYELNKSLCTSTVLCDFTHLSGDVTALKKLTMDSLAMFKEITTSVNAGRNGKTGWTNDSKLDLATEECIPEVSFLQISDGNYKCPFENSAQCSDPGRIQSYTKYVGYDMLSARFERKMMQIDITTSVDDPLDISSENYGFVTTATMNDIAAIYHVYTKGYQNAFSSSVETLLSISVTALSVEIVVLVACFFAFVIPIKMSLTSIERYTIQLKTLIPDNLTEHLALTPEQRTGVTQIDSGRKKLFEVLTLLYDAVISFSSKSEIKALSVELLQQTKTQFSAEEKLMLESQYDTDDYEAHKKDHLRIRQRITYLTDNITAGSEVVAFGSINILGNIFAEHFSTLDKTFGGFYAKEMGLTLDDGDSDDDDDAADNIDEAAAMM